MDTRYIQVLQYLKISSFHSLAVAGMVVMKNKYSSIVT